MTGWLLVLGWQADLASAAYLGGVIIQGIAALNYPDFDVQRWQVGLAFLYLSVPNIDMLAIRARLSSTP